MGLTPSKAANLRAMVSLLEIEVISKKPFNGQSEIPLIIKEIASTKISAKLLNIEARNYYRYYLCLCFYQINKLVLKRRLTWTWYCDGYCDLSSAIHAESNTLVEGVLYERPSRTQCL